MSRVYNAEDADPEIVKNKDEIFWLVCIETYKEPRKRRTLLSQYWELAYSTSETCIYQLKCNPKLMIVGFRGTKEPKDLYDDYKITMAEVFPRSTQAIVFLRGIYERVPDARIQLCGHSLGGAIARVAGYEVGLPVVTFNAAAPPTAPVIGHVNERNYHIVFDLVSAWQTPYTIRLDKGFRPIPKFWEKLIQPLWIRASVVELLKSHSLKNFSRDLPSRVICGEEETEAFARWLRSLPLLVMIAVKVTLFGISGDAGLPNINGCYFYDQY